MVRNSPRSCKVTQFSKQCQVGAALAPPFCLSARFQTRLVAHDIVADRTFAWYILKCTTYCPCILIGCLPELF